MVSDQHAGPPTWPFRRSVRILGDTLRDCVVTPFIKHWVSITTEGADNIRSLGEPAIFIFNHSDDFDAPVIYAALPRIKQGGVSLVVVEQDIAQAMAVADRVYCFQEGRVTLSGPPSALSRDQIHEAYFGH